MNTFIQVPFIFPFGYRTEIALGRNCRGTQKSLDANVGTQLSWTQLSHQTRWQPALARPVKLKKKVEHDPAESVIFIKMSARSGQARVCPTATML